MRLFKPKRTECSVEYVAQGWLWLPELTGSEMLLALNKPRYTLGCSVVGLVLDEEFIEIWRKGEERKGHQLRVNMSF